MDGLGIAAGDHGLSGIMAPPVAKIEIEFGGPDGDEGLIERRRTPFQAMKEGGDRCVRRGGETAAIPIECVAHRQGI